MNAINPTIQLAKIRSQIDQQQQVIGQLEMELQYAILGSPDDVADRSLGDIVDTINDIYDGYNSDDLEAAFTEGVEAFVGSDNLDDVLPEQDSIRHMLYQARALLGELRIEEQQWNEEAKEEKTKRKDLTDLAKG